MLKPIKSKQNKEKPIVRVGERLWTPENDGPGPSELEKREKKRRERGLWTQTFDLHRIDRPIPTADDSKWQSLLIWNQASDPRNRAPDSDYLPPPGDQLFYCVVFSNLDLIAVFSPLRTLLSFFRPADTPPLIAGEADLGNNVAASTEAHSKRMDAVSPHFPHPNDCWGHSGRIAWVFPFPACIFVITPCWGCPSVFRLFIIRAKRVSNCYMQEKKNWPSVCPDVRLILVLVLGRQIIYGQNTVYLCLSKYIVF